MESLKDLYTIVYFTSNHEDCVFEEKIRANILKNKGDISVISVSQKPIDFGKNICVGDVGLSYQNEYHQTLIGALEAVTPYIIFAESDFLYPEDYFTFIPGKENLYRHDNVWIVWKTRKYGSYIRKLYSEGAQISRRDYLIQKYTEYFVGLPEWSVGKLSKKYPFYKCPFGWFSGQPCVSFKTGDGVRATTNVIKDFPHEKVLQPWGTIKDLRMEYL